MIYWVLRMSLKLDENKSMVRYPWNWNYGWGVPAHQILETFFDKQNITPSWTDCEQDWGGLNSSTGLWTGAVGEVIKIIEFQIIRGLLQGCLQQSRLGCHILCLFSRLSRISRMLSGNILWPHILDHQSSSGTFPCYKHLKNFHTNMLGPDSCWHCINHHLLDSELQIWSPLRTRS